MNRKELLYRFFEVTGDEKDSLVYLKKFRERESGSFALVYCTSDCFSETGETLLFNLRLMQGLELFPILLVDASVPDYLNIFYGKLINLESENLESSINLKIINKDFRKDVILQSIAEKKIPMILFEEFNEDKLFQEIIKLINEFRMEKFIYLSPERLFIRGSTDISISIINFSDQEDFRNKISSLKKNEIQIINFFKTVLENCSSTLRSISVTTPISLFKELFTVKGSGTFFKLGSKIDFLNPSQVNKSRLGTLLEDAFQKKIKPEFFHAKIDTVILESEYRGAAILRKTEHGVLLSKFAVDEIARGEGIGRELWDKMKKEYDKIFWRAKKENPINKWYFKECDGVVKGEIWNYYWIGIQTKNLEKILEILNKLPIDFYE